MRTYAYVRVDPNTQFDINRYINLFNDCGFKVQKNRLVVEEVLVDKLVNYRDKLLNLINYSLEADDILVVKGIDCLGSNFNEILKIFYKIEEKKIRFICLDYSKNEINGDLKVFFIHFLKICLEYENLFKFENNKVKGLNTIRKVGRPEILSNQQKEKVIELYKKGYSVYSLAKEFSVTRTVIRRILDKASKTDLL